MHSPVQSDASEDLGHLNDVRHHNSKLNRIVQGTGMRSGLSPSQQMTLVLQLLLNGADKTFIVKKFGGDGSLVQLLITSLAAFGFLKIKGDSLLITEKGKSRAKRNPKRRRAT